MADHDKDRTNPTAGPTARPAGYNTDAGNSSQDRFVGSSSAGSTGSGVGTTSSASGKRTVDEAKEYAGKVAGRAKEQGRSLFDRQKDSATKQVDSVVNAFRNTAGQLEGEGQSQTGRYVNMTADRLESFGRRLREKDLDSLVHDAENLSRRAPGAFFAGSLIAGFLFARFLKSSAEHRYAESEMASDEWDMRTQGEIDSTDALSDVRAAASSGVGSRSSASSVGTGGTTSTSAAGSSGSVSGSADLDTSASSTTGTIGSLGSSTPTTTSTEAKPGGNSYGNR